MKLRHLVLFGFGKAHSSAAIAEVIRRFAELKALVRGIDDFEWGENSSAEGLNHGHSHVFLLTFANAQARDAYLVHPDHAAFANWVQPFVSSVTVFWIIGSKRRQIEPPKARHRWRLSADAATSSAPAAGPPDPHDP